MLHKTIRAVSLIPLAIGTKTELKTQNDFDKLSLTHKLGLCLVYHLTPK
jgi:hypothetical protein